jgi:hypothetical protein
VRRCSASNDRDLQVTMFPTSPTGDTSKRSLHADDVAGVCTIYPLGGPPQATGGDGQSNVACGSASAPGGNGGSSSGGGSSGCSTAGAGDAAALLLALAVLAGDRLRRKLT